MDGRHWEFETPGVMEKWVSLNEHLGQYYKELYIAYLLSDDNLRMSQFLINRVNTEFKPVMEWQFFLHLDHCISWLTKNGIGVQDLTEKDLPEPMPAFHYLP